MADKLDKTTRGILGDINPEPGTRDHLRGGDGITDDENDDRAGSRDVSEGGGVATETGGTRNYHHSGGATGGDLGNRPE
jgi:hypothetical protein